MPATLPSLPASANPATSTASPGSASAVAEGRSAAADALAVRGMPVDQGGHAKRSLVRVRGGRDFTGSVMVGCRETALDIAEEMRVEFETGRMARTMSATAGLQARIIV